MITCNAWLSGQCHSCRWLDLPPAQQLARRQRHLHDLLSPFSIEQWEAPALSAAQRMRNKAKMVVSGSVERPILGIVNAQGEGRDLCDCPLYPAHFAPVFRVLKTFIARASLTPYHIVRRRGELKALLLTESALDQRLMLRFVLRSTRKLDALRRSLPWLLAQLPALSVVSANIQPIPMAILEGEEEIPLTEQQMLRDRFNNVPLWMRPGGFFQTNPQVAAQLYATAQRWTAPLPVRQIWDLFCGSGGFGLHCTRPGVRLTGIEISADAIRCARRSAAEMKLTEAEFCSLDTTTFALRQRCAPDLVIVNPPRRGLGETLCRQLNETLAPRWLLYSSCQAETLAQDLQRLPHYRILRARLFDMFPHTPHYETLLLLARTAP